MLKEPLTKDNQGLPGSFGLSASTARSTADEPMKILRFFCAAEPAPYVELPVLVIVKELLKLALKSSVTDNRVPNAGLNCVRSNCLLQSVDPEMELVKDIVSALASGARHSNKATPKEILRTVLSSFCFIHFLPVVYGTTL